MGNDVTGVVEVHYQGRLGNRLTQYCIGRIIAERLGFELKAAGIPGFPNAQPLVSGARARTASVQALGGHRIDLERTLADGTPRRIIVGGFFQRYEYVQPHKSTIRDAWLASGVPARSGPEDLAIHIRAGDIWLENNRHGQVHGDYHALPFSFYRDIVSARRWTHVTVVTEERSDPMVRKLAAQFDADIRSGSAIDDFNFLRASSNLVLSVSSYAWWAGWLSRAARIFYPVAGCFDTARNEARPAAWQQDFWVHDEPRYVAVRPSGADRPWSGTPADRQRLLDS